MEAANLCYKRKNKQNRKSMQIGRLYFYTAEVIKDMPQKMQG